MPFFALGGVGGGGCVGGCGDRFLLPLVGGDREPAEPESVGDSVTAAGDPVRGVDALPSVVIGGGVAFSATSRGFSCFEPP